MALAVGGFDNIFVYGCGVVMVLLVNRGQGWVFGVCDQYLVGSDLVVGGDSGVVLLLWQ